MMSQCRACLWGCLGDEEIEKGTWREGREDLSTRPDSPGHRPPHLSPLTVPPTRPHSTLQGWGRWQGRAVQPTGLPWAAVGPVWSQERWPPSLAWGWALGWCGKGWSLELLAVGHRQPGCLLGSVICLEFQWKNLPLCVAWGSWIPSLVVCRCTGWGRGALARLWPPASP